MSGNAGPEVELTRGLGIGIGVFIALFAVAILAFALHLGGDPQPPSSGEPRTTSAHPVSGELAPERPHGVLTRQ